MAAFTPNYGLHQWVAEDHFLRTDFNEDLVKIDTALGEKADEAAVTDLRGELSSVSQQVSQRCRAVLGSYVGDGSSPRTIYTGSTPKAVYLNMGSNTICALSGGGTVTQVTVVSGGFRLESGSAWVNQSGTSYTYLVLF